MVQLTDAPPTGAVFYLIDGNGRLLLEVAATDTTTPQFSLDRYPSETYTLVLIQQGKLLWQGRVTKI